MADNYFDFYICETNTKLKDHSDFDLVRLAQKDIDKFRNQCYWKCQQCGHELMSLDSLISFSEFYIHDIRCKNKIHRKSRHKICNSKMNLVNIYGNKMDSIYFNELFSRYQKRLVQESAGCSSIDHPDEIYSSLVTCFLKIVAQFARNKNLKEVSEKWFSSFFWQSIQNKISDLKKTNNYAKRCPPTQCKCCGKMVGQITQAHLKKDGHEEIMEYIYAQFGESLLYDKRYTKCESIIAGKAYLDSISENKRKKIIECNLISAYTSMYPNSYIKNKIGSINDKISDDFDSGELGDTLSDNFFQDPKSIIEEIDIGDKIKVMSSVIMDDYSKEINKYFEKGQSIEDKIKTIEDVIRKKVNSYNFSEENTGIEEIDMYIEGVKTGFTNTVFSCLRKSVKCAQILGATKAICEKSY